MVRVPSARASRTASLPLAEAAVVPVHRLGEAYRCRGDVDRRDVDAVPDHLHRLWMEDVEGEGGGLRPHGVPGHLVDGGDQRIVRAATVATAVAVLRNEQPA
jgi:hypothetical protein